MLEAIKRNLYKVPLCNGKLQEFWYCTYAFKGDIHELLADELIKNNKILSYMRDNDQDTLEFLKTNLKDKLKALKGSAAERGGDAKNDGIYMNFLSYEALREFHDVLPLYLLQRSDVEKPKFGVDAVFYKGDDVWVFEFKSSISQLDEHGAAKKIHDGVESLLCKGTIKSATLYDCKTNIHHNGLNLNLLNILQSFINDRGEIEKLLDNPHLKFNVCIVSPSGKFSESDIIKYIHEEYFDCNNCIATGSECKTYKCVRYKNVKIFNAFHVQLPTDFSLEKLYDKLIEKIGGSDNG